MARVSVPAETHGEKWRGSLYPQKHTVKNGAGLCTHKWIPRCPLNRTRDDQHTLAETSPLLWFPELAFAFANLSRNALTTDMGVRYSGLTLR